MLQKFIHNLVLKSIEKNQKEGIFSGFDVPEVKIDYRGDGFADYASGIALNLSKVLNQDPMGIAEKILSKIEKSDLIDKIEVKTPGFINFFVSSKLASREMGRLLREKDRYGNSSLWKEKKIIVEFTDPNPFKEFHIGHLYSNIVGEAIARLARALGARVRRVNYQGDVGLHVAKAIWGMQKKLSLEKINFAQLEAKNLEEKAKFLGQSYTLGSRDFDENENAKKAIIELNKKIFNLDKSIKDFYQKGKRWSLLSFEKTYKRLGTKFDCYYFESKVAPVGVQLVEDGFKKGIFQKSEGAVIFPGEKYGLHSRVFINSQGLPTYEAKELGLAKIKYKDFKYDLSIIVTGSEIVEYFKVLMAATRAVLPVLGSKTMHLPHGMVRLSEGKMASRKGNIVTGEGLLDQVKSLAVSNISSSAGFSDKERSVISEMVAIGAVKYAWLKNRIGQDIIFDPQKSLNIKGDSGSYLQYTVVRCQSVIKKSKASFSKLKLPKDSDNIPEEELSIIKFAIRFPEVVEESAQKFSPNIVCGFAFNLAQKYNAFYDNFPIISIEDKNLRQIRLCLTVVVAQVLKNSLFLLGINVPERM